MKTVYPNALIFDQQTHIPGMYGYACYNSYQLTVKVNTEETGDSDATSNDGDIKEQPRLSTRPPHLASSILLKRRQRFRRNLVGIVKEHHKVSAFLMSYCIFVAIHHMHGLLEFLLYIPCRNFFLIKQSVIALSEFAAMHCFFFIIGYVKCAIFVFHV